MDSPSSLLAYCTNPRCGLTFRTRSPFPVTNAGAIIFEGNLTTCPRCNSEARYQDIRLGEPREYYREQAVRLVVNTKESPETMQAVKQVLEEAGASATTKEEVIEKVATTSPEIAQFLRTINGDTFQKWLAHAIQIIVVAISLLTYLETKRPDETQEVNKQSIEANKQSIEQLREDIREVRRAQDQLERQHPITAPGKAPSRNDLCPCQSGKKFKKCHGLTTPPSPAGPRT